MSSGTLKFNLKPAGITRYRRLPLILGVSGFGIILFFLIMQLSHRTEVSRETSKQKESQTSAVASDAHSQKYWFEDDKYNHLHRSQPVEDSPSPSLIKNEAGTSGATEIPLTPSDHPIPAPQGNTEKEFETLHRSQMIDAEKIHMDAIRSPARVPVMLSRGNENNAANGQAGKTPPILPASLPTPAAESDQDQKLAFLKKTTEEEHYLKHLKTTPLSATEIKAGTVIPAALVTGLNSDLPGSVIGQVRENVYDTVTGNMLLIPQGAKLIGDYDSHVNFGQERALVVWKRLLFPDGKSITLERMQGTDSEGYAGFSDKVNHHYSRIYGNAMLLSLLGSGYELLNKDVGNSPTATDTVAASVGQQLAQVSNEMIRKNLTIQPTINIRPGYKFNVVVMKDVILEDLENL